MREVRFAPGRFRQVKLHLLDVLLRNARFNDAPNGTQMYGAILILWRLGWAGMYRPYILGAKLLSPVGRLTH